MQASGSVRVIAALAVVCSLGNAAQLPRDRAPAPEQTGTAVIAGRVLIDINSSAQPVRRARITLESDTVSARTTDTDVDGRYRFRDLPPGSYRVRAEKGGFVAFVRDARRAFDRPPPMDVANGQTVTHDVWMARGAALEGRVMIDTGVPGADIVVSALRFAYDDGGRRAVPVAQARSDDRGRFRIHTLPPGEFYLEAAPDPLRVNDRIPIPGRRPTRLARSFFPAAPTIEGGRTLSLTYGQEIDGLDFTLSTVPAVAVTGKVVASTGTPEVSLPRIQRVGGPVGEVRGTGSNTGGDFQYSIVPPGEYWLMGIARTAKGADPEFGAIRISVGGQDLANLSVPTAKGALVNGRVEIDGGATLALNALQVVAHQIEFELPTVADYPANWGAPVSVAADGTFTLKDVFGPRLLRVTRLPAGWALMQALLDGSDITDTPMDFRGGDRPRELRLVITAQTSSVEGVVRDQLQKPVAGARVVAFSLDEQKWKFRSRMIKAAESGPDGRYLIEGLPVGQYHIAAVPYLEQGAWMDAAVLRRLEPGAVRWVALEPARSSIDLVVKP